MIYLIIILAIIARFIPHIPNFSPITAIAIFSAVHLDWKKAAGITFAARFVSDAFLGFFSWPLMVAVYLSHLVGIFLGFWIKRSMYVIPSDPPVGGESRNRLNIDIKGSLHSSSDALVVGRDDKKKQWLKITASSLGASIIFFLATNFAFLYSNYPHNFSGIIQAYINGLPFLRGTLMGDMFYSAALFGGYGFVMRIYRLHADIRIPTDS